MNLHNFLDLKICIVISNDDDKMEIERKFFFCLNSSNKFSIEKNFNSKIKFQIIFALDELKVYTKIIYATIIAPVNISVK